jgi:hypothetical protein
LQACAVLLLLLGVPLLELLLLLVRTATVRPSQRRLTG